jgi:hypothetical protein
VEPSPVGENYRILELSLPVIHAVILAGQLDEKPRRITETDDG